MIVTEDEARKLWCPMARVSPTATAATIAPKPETQAIFELTFRSRAGVSRAAARCGGGTTRRRDTVVSPDGHDAIIQQAANYPYEPAAGGKIAIEREVTIFHILRNLLYVKVLTFFYYLAT